SSFITGATAHVPFWIGLTDVGNGVGSRNYTQWTTGESLTYTNWFAATSEPNNGGSGEDYGAINWHNSNPSSFSSSLIAWTDVPLGGTSGYGGGTDGPYYGIIELAAIPEPATSAACFGVGVLGLAMWRKRRARGGAGLIGS